MRKLNKVKKGAAFMAVTGIAVASGAGLVLADHIGFNDTSASGFESEINSIAHAGVTTGYSDGSYRPGNNITREAMAAFMERGFGRVEYAVGDETTAASVTVEGGASGTTELVSEGYFLVTASWTATAGDTSGNVTVTITDTSGDIVGGLVSGGTLGGVGTLASGTSQAIDVVTSTNSSETYTATASVPGTGTAEVSLSAVYVPFDGDADDSTFLGTQNELP